MDSFALVFDQFRTRIYNWRVAQNFVVKMTMAVGCAVVIGLAAHVKILTPLSPVAFSLSTAAVLLTAVLLGRHWGAVAVAIYVAMAVLGLPVMTASLGITFGYVVGFFAAALLIGYLVDKVVKSRHFWPLFAVMVVSSVIILLGGSLWMWVWLGTQVSLLEIMRLAFVPFVITDLLKSAAVAMIATTVLPKKTSLKS